MSVDTPFWDHYFSGAPMTAPVAQPVVTKPSPDPARPGYTTTEFWTSTVAPLFFLLLAQFKVGVDSSNPHVEAYVKLGSYLLAALGVSFYAISRGHMKKGAAIAAAIKDFTGNLPGVVSSAGALVPQRIQQQLLPVASAIEAVDPKFSDSQIEDLSSIVSGLLQHPSIKLTPQQIQNAVEAGLHNVLGNADSPTVLLNAARDVQEVEDVVHGATATSFDPPAGATAGDGATFVAPNFP